MWLAKLVTLGALCLPSVAGQVTVVMDVTITDFFPPLTEESQVWSAIVPQHVTSRSPG